jgi:hypothetical protein
VMDASFVLKISLVADNPGAVQERAPVSEWSLFIKIIIITPGSNKTSFFSGIFCISALSTRYSAL